MPKYESWNNIASSFIAADKIRNLITQPLSENHRSSVTESSFSTVIEVLRVISEYSPDTNHKQLLGNVIGKSDLYNNTYRSLKTHINSTTDRNIDFDNITKALSIVRPVLNTNHRIAIEKILKIYDIVKS